MTALEDVSLEVEPGTIHAVVGENGAGKTTLMRCLFGVLKPDAGMVEVAGVVREFGSAAEASAAGLGMVSQHYGIVPGLTCLQNLMLGAEEGWAIDGLRAEIRAEALALSLGFEFDWYADAEGLSPAQAQKLEILKLLWRRARIMILDEPTAMLSPPDADALFENLRTLVAKGATAVLVTHRLPEVMNYCSRVTVLRAGRRVADLAVSETSAAELARLIVGGAEMPEPVARGDFGSVRLSVRGLGVVGDRGEAAVREASFEVRAGEVVGLAGVDGSGQRELLEALMGLRYSTGQVAFDGGAVGSMATSERIRLGFRIVPEDRHRQAVIEDWSLELNGGLGMQRRFARGMAVDRAGRRDAATAMADRFGTRRGGLGSAMRTLSGGNQQRFVVGRALYGAPALVLAMQPARGLDLAATAAVYRGIRQACLEGAAALVASFDLDELLEHCDRILVMYGGRLASLPAGFERDRERIGRLMVGAA